MSEFNLTVNKCAGALGFDVRTIKKRIAAANLSPVGKQRGFDVYRLSDVAAICFKSEASQTGYDVNTLTPKQRQEHWSAEKRETEVSKLRGELVEVDKAMEKFAEMAKDFSDFFTTLTDHLEQSGKFSIEQLKVLEKTFDEQRREFAQREFM